MLVSNRYQSNILSKPLRPEPNTNLIVKIQLNFEEIALALVTWHEILSSWVKLNIK